MSKEVEVEIDTKIAVLEERIRKTEAKIVFLDKFLDDRVLAIRKSFGQFCWQNMGELYEIKKRIHDLEVKVGKE